MKIGQDFLDGIKHVGMIDREAGCTYRMAQKDKVHRYLLEMYNLSVMELVFQLPINCSLENESQCMSNNHCPSQSYS